MSFIANDSERDTKVGEGLPTNLNSLHVGSLGLSLTVGRQYKVATMLLKSFHQNILMLFPIKGKNPNKCDTK